MHSSARITAEKIAMFTELMRAKVLTGEVAFRRAYIRSMIDNVEVDDVEIRIHGSPHGAGAPCNGRRSGCGRSAQFCS